MSQQYLNTGDSQDHENKENELDQCDISSLTLNGGSDATRSRASSRFNHLNGFGAPGFSRSYEDLRPNGSGSDGLVITGSLVTRSPNPPRRQGAGGFRESPIGQSTLSVSQEVLSPGDNETVSRSLLLPSQSVVNSVGSNQSSNGSFSVSPSCGNNQNNQNVVGTVTIGPEKEGLILTDPPSPKEFQIFVKRIDGKSFTFEVRLEDKVQSLMEMINDRIEIPPEYQVLSCSGKPLEAEKTLASYDVKPLCTVFLTMRCRGG